MSTQDFWKNEGGSEYTLRNADVDWRKRTSFWRDTIPADVRTAFELGTNVGANLRAIRACRSIQTQGIEINEDAVKVAQDRGLAVQKCDLFKYQAAAMWDISYTCGVLIHMSPDQIGDAMETVAASSRKYVMAVEYMDDVETMVNYRGSDDLLWRRPYGALYEAMGLRIIRTGEAGEGFDRCGFVLCEKK